MKEGEKISGADALKTIPRDREIAVTFTGDEKAPVRVQVAVKQPYKVAPEKLVTVEQMQELVAQGSAAGKFTLVDSQPGSGVSPKGLFPVRSPFPLRSSRRRRPPFCLRRRGRC